MSPLLTKRVSARRVTGQPTGCFRLRSGRLLRYVLLAEENFRLQPSPGADVGSTASRGPVINVEPVAGRDKLQSSFRLKRPAFTTIQIRDIRRLKFVFCFANFWLRNQVLPLTSVNPVCLVQFIALNRSLGINCLLPNLPAVSNSA